MMFGSVWIFWIFLIVGLVFLFKWIFQENKGSAVRMEKNVLEILKQKYVRGEIEKQEFEQKKKDLFY